MTAKPKSASTGLQPAAPPTITPAGILGLTIASNQIASNAGSANPYEVRNGLLVEQQKARVRYEKGITLAASVEVLLANAERRDYNHRRTLSRNIVAATVQPRPADVDAHHVVALRHDDAKPSRLKLFQLGIGINDADNGMFLPATGAGMPGYPNAPHHKVDHAQRYHLTVFNVLQYAADNAQGRNTLRLIKGRVLSGALPLGV
jgi:A nuclease family of the HNH/ENDO VII superfamily with conserved AHH